MKKEIKINITTVMPLALVFIILKLTNVIAWPWLWVLAPIWLIPALIGAIIGLFAIVGLIVIIVGSFRN